MFGELFDTLKVGFGIGITVGIIALIAGIFKGLKDNKEAERHRKWEEDENRKIINTVIAEARQFPTNVVISQKEEVARVYNELLACKRAGSFKVKEHAWIRVGDKFGVSMDLDTSYTILQHLNNEIKRRNG